MTTKTELQALCRGWRKLAEKRLVEIHDLEHRLRIAEEAISSQSNQLSDAVRTIERLSDERDEARKAAMLLAEGYEENVYRSCGSVELESALLAARNDQSPDFLSWPTDDNERGSK